MVRVVPDEFCALAEVMLYCVPCIVIAIASRKDDNTKVHRYVFWGGHFQFTRWTGAGAGKNCGKVMKSDEKCRNGGGGQCETKPNGAASRLWRGENYDQSQFFSDE